jgi:hypothetical protein
MLTLLPFMIAAVLLPHTSASRLLAQDCPTTRLAVGEQGRVTPGAANRVRAMPSTSGELLGEIPGGEAFTVLEGPECAGGFLWWRVDYGGLVGWTSEGNASGYFVEPASAATAATPTPITDSSSADCALPTRLEIGREGRTTTNTPSRLRDLPGTSGAQVGQIDPLDTFIILDGPVCADGIQWWQVDASGAVGWTAEGVDGDYFVEMLALVPTPTPAYIGLNEAQAIAWSADGARIAVGTRDGLYLFDAGDPDAEPELLLPGVEVFELAFHPENPDLIAVAQYDDENFSASLLNLSDGEVVLPLAPARPVGVLSGLTFSADGALLALNSAGQATVIDLEDSEATFAVLPPDWSNGEVAYMGAMDLTLSADGTLLGIYDGVVRALPVGGEITELIEFDRDMIEDTVLALAFSPDATRLIVGDVAGNLQMWEVETGERTSFIRGERSNTSNAVEDLRFTADGARLITAESDPNAVVRAFDALTLQQVDVLDFGTETARARALAFSPDGAQLAVIVDDTVRLLDAATLDELAVLVVRRN